MNKRGFTLVELAVVLIIIGIILGAVLKGRDIVRSARIKQYYNRFLKAWEIAALSWEDRTGTRIKDANTTLKMDNVVSDLKEKGLRPPTSNTDKSYQEIMTGKYNQETVTLYIDTKTVGDKTGKCFYLTPMPADIATAMDTIIDSKANGTDGDFVNENDSDWPDANSTVNCVYWLD